MGASYQNLLVIGDLDDVVAALTTGGFVAIVVVVAPQRVVVLPREGAYGVADVDAIAEYLSGVCAMQVLAQQVSDSDVVCLSVYRDGVEIHGYLSETSGIGEVTETVDGFVRVVDGVAYVEGDPAAPSGPRGAEAGPFIPFGLGETDPGQIAALLGSAPEYVFAEEHHADILRALNLPATALTAAFRWVEKGEVEIPVYRRSGSDLYPDQ
jgi:hypothetical protein